MDLGFLKLFRKIKYIPNWLYGYEIQNSSMNGEYRYYRKAMKQNKLIFEVGANVGDHIAKYFQYNKSLQVHAFEPVSHTFKHLSNRYSANEVVLINAAVGKETGFLKMYIYSELCGGNSLYLNDFQLKANNDQVIKEEVKVIKLDDYINEKKIFCIDFMKIDVEGNEFNVLLGAEECLHKKIFKVIQFEYSKFSKDLGYDLSTICKFLESKGYAIHRLTPWGKIRIKKFKKWDEVSGNYLAVIH